jgi:uncharacterized glyoxalase superfamily protein PhnB
MAEQGSNIYPFMRFADSDAALEWLSRAFGFKELVVYRDDEVPSTMPRCRSARASSCLARAIRRRRASKSRHVTGPGHH